MSRNIHKWVIGMKIKKLINIILFALIILSTNNNAYAANVTFKGDCAGFENYDIVQIFYDSTGEVYGDSNGDGVPDGAYNDGNGSNIEAWLNDDSVKADGGIFSNGGTAKIRFKNTSTGDQIAMSVEKLKNNGVRCYDPITQVVSKGNPTTDENQINSVISTFTCGALQTTNLYRNFLQPAFTFIKFATPALVVFMCIFDFASAALAQDNTKMQKAAQKAVKRIIIGVFVFFVPILVDYILKLSSVGAGTCGIK